MGHIVNTESEALSGRKCNGCHTFFLKMHIEWNIFGGEKVFSGI